MGEEEPDCPVTVSLGASDMLRALLGEPAKPAKTTPSLPDLQHSNGEAK